MPEAVVVRHRERLLLLGWYGCSAADRIVAVAWSGHHRLSAPRSRRIVCPACNSRHRVEPMWRNPHDLVEWRAAEVRFR